MDENTILFKGEGFSHAFDERFFKNNFEELIKLVKDSRNIFYKFNNNRDSWFDIKEAFNIIDGFKKEKYYNGYKTLKLSSVLSELPETVFTDQYGYMHTIERRDGLAVFNTIDRVQSQQITLAQSIDFDGNLVVDSNVPLNNAIVCLNHVFYDYTQVTPNRIIFDKNTSFFNSNEPNENAVRVFLWNNLIKQPRVQPISRDEEWFVFENEIDTNSLLFYNGVYYLYERNLVNPKKLRLIDIDLVDYSTFDLNKMYLVKFVHVDPLVEIAKIDAQGNNNYAENFSSFEDAVTNSMVLYNGVHHDYTLTNSDRYVNYSVPDELDDFTDGIVSATQFIY
jgi:hypothetical protein